MPSTATSLLDPRFLRQLEALELISRRVFVGRMRGERRSKRKGSSIEFAEYREYSPGDDLRYLDWNAYARLDRLFLKQFMEEEDLSIYLLLDCSASMGFGSPSKLDWARRFAAALGYIGLTTFDRVGAVAIAGGDPEHRRGAVAIGGDPERLVPLALSQVEGSAAEGSRGAGGNSRTFRAVRGRAQAIGLFRWLEELHADGRTGLYEALRRFTLRTRQPGLAIICSDFLDPDWRRGLLTLVHRKFDLLCVQVLDPTEVNPTLAGDLKLVDSETGETREITVTGALLRTYKRRLAAFQNDLRAFGNRYGARVLAVTTDQPVEDIVLKTLRRAGVVK